jgi:ring-1,2-phenylacetyl-CoA epoxidase subunit PaaE
MEFAPLRVVAREQLTDDAVALTFDADWPFLPGQHLTLRRWVGEQEHRRTYSVCSPVGGPLRIGAKVLPGGLVSPWVLGLQPGDVVEALPPSGTFGPRGPLAGARLGLVAAGSGITPVFAVAATALAEGAQVLLLYGNRTSRDVMLLEDLEDLKDRYLPRFQLVHVLSREDQGSDLLTGRMEGSRLERLLEVFGVGVDAWYLCGPLGLVSAARELLAGHPQVHAELFHADPVPDRPRPAVSGRVVEAVLGGRTSTVTLQADDTVLEAVLRARPEAPYACRGGVCGTCRARVTQGSVDMDLCYALEPDELAAGVVLTCQARPTSERLRVEYL